MNPATWLQGYRTYLVALAMLAHQLLANFLYGTPIDWQAIWEALGLASLRAGVAVAAKGAK